MAKAKKKTGKTAKKAKARASVKPKGVPAAAAIKKLDEEFMKAASAKDISALVRAFYAPSAVLMPPNQAMVSGQAAIQTTFQGLVDAGLTEIKLETTTVASEGGLAYGRGRYTLSISPPGGMPIQDLGKYIVVYRRQPNGQWRAIADIWNSDRPAQ